MRSIETTTPRRCWAESSLREIAYHAMNHDGLLDACKARGLLVEVTFGFSPDDRVERLRVNAYTTGDPSRILLATVERDPLLSFRKSLHALVDQVRGQLQLML